MLNESLYLSRYELLLNPDPFGRIDLFSREKRTKRLKVTRVGTKVGVSGA